MKTPETTTTDPSAQTVADGSNAGISAQTVATAGKPSKRRPVTKKRARAARPVTPTVPSQTPGASRPHLPKHTVPKQPFGKCRAAELGHKACHCGRPGCGHYVHLHPKHR